MKLLKLSILISISVVNSQIFSMEKTPSTAETGAVAEIEKILTLSDFRDMTAGPGLTRHDRNAIILKSFPPTWTVADRIDMIRYLFEDDVARIIFPAIKKGSTGLTAFLDAMATEYVDTSMPLFEPSAKYLSPGFIAAMTAKKEVSASSSTKK